MGSTHAVTAVIRSWPSIIGPLCQCKGTQRAGEGDLAMEVSGRLPGAYQAWDDDPGPSDSACEPDRNQQQTTFTACEEDGGGRSTTPTRPQVDGSDGSVAR